MKICTRCGVQRPYTQFHKRARSKDGRRSECKPCNTEYRRELASREHVLAKDGMKICTQCGVQRPYIQFSKDVSSKDGHKGWCKPCVAEYCRTNASRRLESSRELYAKPFYGLLSGAKHRAKNRGLDFDLDVDYLTEILPDVCPVFNTRFVSIPGKRQGATLSLDRIDNSKGYVKGNVQFLSYKANAMKGAATREELLTFAKWVLQTYEVLP